MELTLGPIGIIGNAGSGKTTIATCLYDNYHATVVKFADPLKDMLRAIGMTEDEIEGERKEKPCELLGGKTPREAMQTLGTDWGRWLIDDDIWVNVWKKRSEQLRGDDNRLVITDDVRFPNEAKAIREQGGVLLKVVRPNYTPEAPDHISEDIGDLPYDFLIENNGTLDDLYEMSQGVVTQFEEKFKRALLESAFSKLGYF